MLVPSSLFVTISIVLPLLLWWGLAFFVYKKFHSYYGILYGLILSGFLFGAFQIFILKVYLIGPQKTVNTYYVLGTAQYHFDNGVQLVDSSNVNGNPTGIINNSPDTLFLDEFYLYKEGDYRQRKEWKKLIAAIDSGYIAAQAMKTYKILPYSFEKRHLEQQHIQYFFADSIPKFLPKEKQGFLTRNSKKHYRLRAASPK